MAFTQTQLDALDQAIAAGVLRVTYDGRTTEYRSLDEMIRIRNMMADAIAGSAQTSRSSLASFRKG